MLHLEKRKRYTPEEKILVLREVVEDGKAVSTVANEHELNPNVILYRPVLLLLPGMHGVLPLGTVKSHLVQYTEY
ncbi:MAG: transposase [Treponema sp.]|nr:transposase [Treponema sp.]